MRAGFLATTRINRQDLGSVGKIVWIEGASLSATKWTSLSMLKRYGKTADRLIALRIGNATSQVSR